MPFTLAHPAAVLPLRRFCPRWLSFPALVFGAMAPDSGYLLGSWGGRLSHSLLGTVAFCLPVGVLMLVVFYGLRGAAVRLLPADDQRVLLPLCQRPAGPAATALVSLLLGIATHLLWDAFTHNEGWAVRHVALLQTPVFTLGNRTARLCHVLWYGCSFAGMAWLFVAFERWKQGALGVTSARGRAVLRDAVLVAVLAVPMQLIHHLVHGTLGLVLAGAFGVLLVAGAVGLRLWKANASVRIAE